MSQAFAHRAQASGMDATSFEGLIAALAREEFVGVGDTGIDVHIEDRHPQRGRDIVITADRDVVLFGIELRRKDLDRDLVIHIECKWTESGFALSQERFSANVAQNRHGNCDAFILVTNTTLTVNALFGLAQEFRDSSTDVFVVDGRRLVTLLEAAGFEIPFDPPSPDLYAINDVACEQQIERLSDNYPQTGELTISLRNLGREVRSGRLFLQNIDEWREAADEPLVHVFDLPPYGFAAMRLLVVRDVPDRRSELRFCLEVGDGTQSTAEPVALSVNMAGRLEVNPTFRGRQHGIALGRLVDRIEDLAPLTGTAGEPSRLVVASVTGAAGTGKSRLVREARKRLDRNRFPMSFFTVGGRFASSVAKFSHEAKRNGLALAALPRDAKLGDLIRAFATAPPVGSQIPILVLEDVHNADEAACEALTQLARTPPARTTSAIVLVTGRTDIRSENPHYDYLLDVFRQQDAKCGPHLTLEALSRGSFRKMVAELLSDAPQAAIEAIERLSARIPQHVIHCIEWLLDMSAVRIVHRASVGVADFALFNRRSDSLPTTVAEILADRFDLLAREPAGPAAQLALAAAALLGTELPQAVLGLSGDAAQAEVRRLLLTRNFLAPSEGLGMGLRWQHESVLLHLRNWLLGKGDAPVGASWRPHSGETWARWASRGRTISRSAAKALLDRPDIVRELSPLDEGLLHALAGDHAAAVSSWADMLDALSRVKGYSTADIDGAYYPYLKWAFESVAALDAEDARLPAIGKGLVYIGGYARSLADGVDAVAFGLRRLARAGPSAARRRDLFWLEALRAHFQLDAGQVRLSQRSLLELQTRYVMEAALREDPRFGYEIYNCLGMLYGYQNHLALSEGYFGLAAQEAERCDDAALTAKLVGDRSILYQFNDLATWERLSLESNELNRTGGTERHRRHAELGALLVRAVKIMEWPNAIERRNALSDALREVREIQGLCEAVGYFSVMPRIQLLQATLLYLLATDATEARRHDDALLAEADRAADRGLGIGLERGIGFSSWQLANLRAMIALRRSDWSLARRRLEGAKDILRADGLLFLGAGDLACPNQIVLANLLKILHERHTTPQVRDVLRLVSTYETEDWSRGRNYEAAMASCLKYHALLAERAPSPAMILDENIRPRLGLVCWF
jgi:hypothetical protein